MNFSMSSFISVGDAPTGTWIIGCRPNAPRAAAIWVASAATPQVFRWKRALWGPRKRLANKNGCSRGAVEAPWARFRAWFGAPIEGIPVSSCRHAIEPQADVGPRRIRRLYDCRVWCDEAAATQLNSSWLV